MDGNGRPHYCWVTGTNQPTAATNNTLKPNTQHATQELPQQKFCLKKRSYLSNTIYLPPWSLTLLFVHCVMYHLMILQCTRMIAIMIHVQTGTPTNQITVTPPIQQTVEHIECSTAYSTVVYTHFTHIRTYTYMPTHARTYIPTYTAGTKSSITAVALRSEVISVCMHVHTRPYRMSTHCCHGYI